MKIKCPRWKSKDYVKNGKMNKKQRYLCKECKYNFSSFKKRGKPKEVKKKVLKKVNEQAEKILKDKAPKKEIKKLFNGLFN